MRLDFVNRAAELGELDAAASKGGLLAVHGRRRVGKTRLLVEWLGGRGGWYRQAIEGPLEMQVQQACCRTFGRRTSLGLRVRELEQPTLES